MLYLASYVVYLALQIPGSLLDGLFHLSQFIQAGYVANFGLEIVDVALGTAYQRTQGASNAGKFSGPTTIRATMPIRVSLEMPRSIMCRMPFDIF